MSRDIPIIFSAPMVRALLDGRKTMTRRLAWSKTTIIEDLSSAQHEDFDVRGFRVDERADGSVSGYARPSPWQKVKPGDRLWVRETWQTGTTVDGPQISYRAHPDFYSIDAWNGPDEGAGPTFNYDRCPGVKWHHWLGDVLSNDGPWRTPIHMPRWASRLTLIVTDVSVQRLQEISREDAVAEGATSHQRCYGFGQLSDGWSMDWRDPYTDHALATPQSAFGNFINGLHGGENWNLKPTNLWDENPEVVAITFTVHKQNIDAMPASPPLSKREVG